MQILLATTLDIAPVPKARPRTSAVTYAVVGGKRLKIRDAHTYTPARTREYEEKVAWALRRAGARPVTGDLGLNLVFHTQRTGDADNFAKAVMDAGNGILYVDDAQLVDIHIRIERDMPGRTDLILFRPAGTTDTS